MTIALCTAACKAGGYSYAGAEYGGECYCSNSAPANGATSLTSGCAMTCNGNSSEFCGAGNQLNVYKAGTPPVVLKTGWYYKGCYVDNNPGRALANGQNVLGGAANMTVENCESACKAAGYSLAGVEYSGECYCDNSFQPGGVIAPDGETGCSMACNGNTTQMCGGANRLNVYSYYDASAPTSTAAATSVSTAAPTTPAGWTAVGCTIDNVGGRSLTNQILGPQGATMTWELCTAGCKAAGYQLAGLEYGGECWCDNTLKNGGAPATDGCTMACNGNKKQTCGGPNRLTLFKQGASAASSSAAVTAASSSVVDGASSIVGSTTVLDLGSTASAINTATVASTAATPTASGTAKTLPSGWTYAGCWADNVNGLGRSMANGQPDSQTLTIESCAATCAAAGYTIAGMEFSTQCFCDNFIHNGAGTTPESDCSMTCSGDKTEKCGGPNRLSVYGVAPIKVLPIPKPQNTSLPGSWKYVGCLKDNINNVRTLPYQSIFSKTNNATTCLSLCSQYKFPAGGMEYGEECYCGDIPGNKADLIAPEGDCQTVCPGNPTAICGAGNRLSYYEWVGDPLYTFNYPTGNAAGQYKFLIGGVVIPLMTFVGVNGKVTFLEKFGTGAPNTTGVYEFDPSLSNDFSKAWRTMHVKTDIFCSAGLTLPDKAGRQMTIGGWSGVSTEGVRLYTPSGVLGTNGTTDWQEDPDQVQLQVGRWYPSAMIMANGSILVVGGEKGSNDAAVPSLELLPAGSAPLFMDWLQRTDPFNLYPFLAVLPSGGIFVAYYNEARILDEGTFATTKTLPNMPGAVNNPLGGRTYPLEGTMMILPQSPPYTQPLGILICGGSTPGGGNAIDNCVSTQPEATNPTWTIERMPSRRVISCMVALPDGTYLILNGAQQGVAGFGLANTPNLNAVLYNPTAPVGTRMSIMANTTIARLYHSEAILMADGRVLVTGSDPQDGKNPEEYRVEVFIPPYLMGNPVQPQVTMNANQKDWAYGGTYTFSVDQAVAKVSLLGAEASTHGNTMGQRTFFPAFSCAGGSCTVTAPPNAHVCPPGWFKLFALNAAGVPSYAMFVRIGGDPGKIGNWPNFSSFQPLPGV
jgi:hypothetical protein